MGLIPGVGTKILHTAQYSPKKKKKMVCNELQDILVENILIL